MCPTPFAPPWSSRSFRDTLRPPLELSLGSRVELLLRLLLPREHHLVFSRLSRSGSRGSLSSLSTLDRSDSVAGRDRCSGVGLLVRQQRLLEFEELLIGLDREHLLVPVARLLNAEDARLLQVRGDHRVALVQGELRLIREGGLPVGSEGGGGELAARAVEDVGARLQEAHARARRARLLDRDAVLALLRLRLERERLDGRVLCVDDEEEARLPQNRRNLVRRRILGHLGRAVVLGVVRLRERRRVDLAAGLVDDVGRALEEHDLIAVDAPLVCLHLHAVRAHLGRVLKEVKHLLRLEALHLLDLEVPRLVERRRHMRLRRFHAHGREVLEALAPESREVSGVGAAARLAEDEGGALQEGEHLAARALLVGPERNPVRAGAVRVGLLRLGNREHGRVLDFRVQADLDLRLQLVVSATAQPQAL
mmetsp:Transcript_48206/g.114705  ORF Transcript_48206/g.114705 Transcript_48206/m.114705 type:complete len:423 (-) Transcript_48206:266-1534(-)